MCNPTSSATKNATPPQRSSATKNATPPQPHLYLAIVCLNDPNPQHEKPPSKHTQIQIPSLSEILAESKSLFNFAFPMIVTALLLYSRSAISMLFLGSLGDLELAGGSLAIAFANITGYSVLSGLSLGMEPLCSQAFGACRPKLLSLTLHRSVLFLMSASLPIFLLWLKMSKIVSFLGQDPKITYLSQKYLLFCLPDLVSHSFIHPIRIYLRAQGITRPLTLATAAGAVLHLPISFLLVTHLKLGVSGVAAASAASNLIVLAFLVLYVWITRKQAPTWASPNRDCLTGWGPLVRLAAPSCVSVCLEWWWYEIMIILCGLLTNPKATVASMGVLIQTTALVYVFPSSLGLAVSTRVGNELGANRPEKARVSAGVSVSFAALMGFLASGFAAGMRHTWGKMFTTNSEILRLTSAALPILGLCELGNCPQTVACGVLRGSARPTVAANLNLGAFYLVGMPLAVGLGFWLGVGFCGLWIGLLAAQVCCAGLMLYVVGKTDWNEQAKRAQLLTCDEGGGGMEVAGKASSAQFEGEDEPLVSIKADPC